MGNCPRCGEPVAGRETGGHAGRGFEGVEGAPSVVDGPRRGRVPGGHRRCGSGDLSKSLGAVAFQGRGRTVSRRPRRWRLRRRPRSEKAKAEGPTWSHSRLIVVRSAQGADKRPVVMLGHPSGVTEVGQVAGVQKGLLARELIRQAVLLAARDELGLATRDELLGDAAPDAKGSASADFALILRLNGPASVKISREAAEEEPLLDRDRASGRRDP